MKYKKIDPEESFERYKTDLAEYSFILEQQLKKNSYTSTIQEKQKDVLVKKILIG